LFEGEYLPDFAVSTRDGCWQRAPPDERGACYPGLPIAYLCRKEREPMKASILWTRLAQLILAVNVLFFVGTSTIILFE
jgi:hypothetical protein